jgi:Ran GTPase-activating protein (RanGAP) involved in mRNA processing and transport
VLGNPKIEMFNEIPIKKMRSDSIFELDLKEKKIGVEGGMVVAALLPALTLLARVDVRGNDFSGDVAAQLSAAVLGNPKIDMFNEIPIKKMRGDSITELGLRGGEDIGVEGGMVVAGLMPATSRLRECNVRGHKLDSKLAKMLAKIGIEKGIMLFGIKRDQKEANLSDQNLGPVDAILFASDLRVNTLLTSVNLSRNRLGEEGTKLICDALKSNTTLKHVDLSGYLESNVGGPAGAKHVADLLSSSTVLIECNVLRNNLNNESAKILANIGKEKGIMLSGIKRHQNEADFYSRRDNTFLGPVNAILIASDLRVNTLLTSVNLSNNNLGVDGTKVICDALKGNTTLKHLDLSGGYYNPNIGGAAGVKLVADLLGASSLASITLMANDIGPMGAKALAPAFCSNTLLTSVNLSDNNLGEEGTKIICDALKGNTTLKYLDLSGGWRGAQVCNIGGAAGAKHVADLLRASALLACVDVRHNNIKGDAAAQLSAAVLSNLKIEMFNKIPIKEMRSHSILQIDLMDEGIGVVGGLVLAGLIPAMTQLTSIDLSCNDLGPEGVKALTPAIRASELLTSIDVGSNDIDQAASLELLAVMKSKNMVSIGMASCKLGVEGAKQVADLLGASELLAWIDLSGNNLGPEGAKTLAPAISASTVLARVDLRYNNIGPEGAEALAPIISASTLDLRWNDLGLL